MLFLMVQVLMLIDFAYDFQEYALDKIKEVSEKDLIQHFPDEYTLLLMMILRWPA